MQHPLPHFKGIVKNTKEEIAVGTKLFVLDGDTKHEVVVTSNPSALFDYFPWKSINSGLRITKGISIKGNLSVVEGISGISVVDSKERLVGSIACFGSEGLGGTSAIVFPIEYALQKAAGYEYFVEFDNK